MAEKRKIIEDEDRDGNEQMLHARELETHAVLTRGVVHDVNNLLTVILGHADLALMDTSLEAATRSSLEHIHATTMLASEFLNQMLVFSGKGRSVIKLIDINKIIEEMTHLLEVLISKDVTLKYNLSEGIPPIKAEATQMRQVIMNLITNASDAIGNRSGAITISTGALEVNRSDQAGTFLAEKKPEGMNVYIEVSDTGVGMDEEAREKIFEPFFTTKSTGYGLGLAAVLSIVEDHKGAIQVHSEPDSGTTIKVLFPCSAVTAAETTIPV